MKKVREYSDEGTRGQQIVAHLKRWNVSNATGDYIEQRMKYEERRSDLLKRVNNLQKLHNANPTERNKQKLDVATRELRLISDQMKAKYETR